jgi:phosphopantothenoylcysteine decarboxylase/phosphopantothenate--cysteine ligase
MNKMTKYQAKDHSSKYELKGTKSNMLADKRIVIGMTGSVAILETIRLARLLMRNGAEVFTAMTKAAIELVHPNLVEWATGNPVITELTGQIEHVHLCGEHPEKADLLLIAPTTANTIGKIAHGIDDTPVTTLATTALGTGIPIIIVPAMHATMYTNQIVKRNIAILEEIGITFVSPRMEEGKAKIATNEEILEQILKFFSPQDLQGKKVVVTAGPTRVWLDDIRFISNPSSGRTGIEIALEAFRRGADVTLILGPSDLSVPSIGIKLMRVTTPDDIISAIDSLETIDIYLSAAAISDYQPKKQEGKIKSKQEKLTLTLAPTTKILDYVKKKFPKSTIVGFKAESNIDEKELRKSISKSLKEHDIPMVVGNIVHGQRSQGFASTNNKVVIGLSDDRWIELPTQSKRTLATKIIAVLMTIIK